MSTASIHPSSKPRLGDCLNWPTRRLPTYLLRLPLLGWQPPSEAIHESSNVGVYYITLTPLHTLLLLNTFNHLLFSPSPFLALLLDFGIVQQPEPLEPRAIQAYRIVDWIEGHISHLHPNIVVSATLETFTKRVLTRRRCCVVRQQQQQHTPELRRHPIVSVGSRINHIDSPCPCQITGNGTRPKWSARASDNQLSNKLRLFDPFPCPHNKDSTRHCAFREQLPL